MAADQRCLSVFQEWIQVPLLLSTCHRDGRHDAGLPALGQRAWHCAATGAAAAQPQQPLLCSAQVLCPYLGAAWPPPSSPSQCLQEMAADLVSNPFPSGHQREKTVTPWEAQAWPQHTAHGSARLCGYRPGPSTTVHGSARLCGYSPSQGAAFPSCLHFAAGLPS